MGIRVSYVVATRNRREFISDALEAWRALKGPEDELIVIDGASSDGTYELLQEEHPGLIDQLVHEKDRSEAHAWNKSFLRARGELIKLITDDDLFFREGLERSYEVMFDNPEIDVLNTGGEFCVLSGDGSERVVAFQGAMDSPNPYWRTQCGIGLVLRRESLALTGLMDVRHRWVDTSYLVQALHAGADVRFLQVKTFRHRGHPDSASNKNRRVRVRERAQVLEDLNVPFVYRIFGSDPRWYLQNPIQGAERILDRMKRRVTGNKLEEPVWDGKIY